MPAPEQSASEAMIAKLGKKQHWFPTPERSLSRFNLLFGTKQDSQTLHLFKPSFSDLAGAIHSGSLFCSPSEGIHHHQLHVSSDATGGLLKIGGVNKFVNIVGC